jgi:hypothetical protein
MPKKSTRRRQFEDPEAPAVITPLHRKDRVISPVTGAPRAYRKLSPLEATYQKGQLGGGADRYLAQDRFDAGMRYAGLFDLAQVSGRDSTQAMNLNGGSSTSLTLPQAQIDAIRELVSVESHLGERDRRIVRMVCGLGEWPSKAVAAVSADYERATVPRFKEALDALIEAFETARRQPGRVML